MWVLKYRLLIRQVLTRRLTYLLGVLKPFWVAQNTGEQTNVPMGNVETHQLATFADDSTLVSGAKPLISENSGWRSFAEENRTHGILDILSRPVLLTDSSSIWSTSKTANQYPTDAVSNSVFTFPNSILDKSANIVKKLSGFTYFKADVKVRVMVNAQAFSQGKLWIWFSPYELGAGTQTAADNLAAKTGYPGVELDVASGVPVEFSIPYCAPNSHYTLTSDEGTMGDLFLTVLSPLTISDASISVFAWFENIDLTMPTGAEKGVLPDEYFEIKRAFQFTRDDTVFTSEAWGGVPFKTGTESTVTLQAHLLMVTSSGNLIVLPPGIKIKGKIAEIDVSGVKQPALEVTTTTQATGLTGYLVTAMGKKIVNDVYVGIDDSVDLFGFAPDRTYNSTTPIYIYESNNNTIKPTEVDIPNVYSSKVNQVSITSGYLASFSLNSSIYIFPPFVKVKYVDNGGVTINNDTIKGSLVLFDKTAGTLFEYKLAVGTSDVMIVAQSDDSEEDTWYKDYPRAQASEAEVDAMSGVVTNAYKTLKSMTQLPMLSALSTPLSWLERLGTVVSSGFSKPTDIQVVQPFAQLPAKGFTHVMGQDMSVALGAIPDNSIGVNSGVFSTAIDEMDINYICRKSCFLRRDNWTNTSVGKIYSIFVSPGISAISNDLFQPSLLAYVTSMFRYWHGTLRYRISVAKTGFHTGRLRISYHPGALTTGQTYPADNAYSWILDLSVSSEIDIEIPYVSPKPWLSCDLFDHNQQNPFGPTNGNNAVVGSNNLQFTTGVLQIEVLNQLRVAGAASNTVEILTWISASDIEFAVPMMSSFAPAKEGGSLPSVRRVKRDVAPEMPSVPSEVIQDCMNDEGKEQFFNEMADSVDIDYLPEAQAFQNITSATDHMSQLSGAEFNKIFDSSNAFGASKTLSIGEHITNLRELTRRFVPCAYSNGDTLDKAILSVTFDPAWFGSLVSENLFTNMKVFNNSGQLLGAYNNCVSPLEYISKIYRFWRGSRRYKAVAERELDAFPAGKQFFIQAHLSTEFDVNGNVAPPNFQSSDEPPEDRYNIYSTFSHFVDGTNNRVAEISVPYYSDTPIQCISDGTNFTNADSYCIRSKVVFSNGPSANNATRSMLFYMAAGDDFSFGYLIGAPLLKRIVKPFKFPA